MQAYFAPGLTINQAAIEAGEAATSVLTKQFFDCFVLMGGCGATICLLIAIIVFSKSRARRSLGYTATIPMIFNINELMVFGLPIIFNPIMMIPFLLVPLVCYSVSYLAIYIGIVPMITNSIEWTTPIILGGYYATGSIAGALLQIFNVGIGIAIYFPFIKLLDKQSVRQDQKNYESFVNYFKENEARLQNETIINMNNVYGDFAKSLCAELRHDLKKNITMFYQGQYNYDGICVGVESLLRWKHPQYGYIYPPIVVKLITECGMLFEFEEAIFDSVLKDYDQIEAMFGQGVKVSINVTGTTVVLKEFRELLEELNEKYNFSGKNICVEITEKEDMSLNEANLNALREIRAKGLSLAIDDFSMGQTSISYLKYDLFNIIKIDGSLINNLENENSAREIVSSIFDLASSLKMMVIAEVVEREEQKEILHQIGIDCYQGYLYAKAIPLD